MSLTLPPIIAHRGAPQLAPENTLSAFKKAKENGAQWIECDVMLSADDVPVIFHDNTLNRTTNGKGQLAKKTFAELNLLDAGQWFSAEFSQEKIPTLQQLLELTAELQLGINLELKAASSKEKTLAKLVIDALKNWPATQPAPLLSSFSIENLIAVKQLNCPYPLGLNIDSWHDSTLPLAKSLDCYSIHISNKQATPALINTIHKNGFKTLVYTVNDKAHAKTLLAIGVTAVFSDIPNLLT